MGPRIRPSSPSEVLSATFAEVCSLFPATAPADSIQIAARLICTPEKGTRTKADFETFVCNLNTLVHGSDQARLGILFDALTDYGRNPLASSRLTSLYGALMICDEKKKLSLAVPNSASSQLGHEIILSREEFSAIFKALQIIPGIIRFVCDCLYEPALAIAHSSGAGGVAPISTRNTSLQQTYRHKEGFLLKHLGCVGLLCQFCQVWLTLSSLGR